MATPELDEFDRRILAALARDARASNLEMESAVKLSHSAISRRIARLEAAGIIKGYGVRLDHAALGLSVRAFVGVTRAPPISAMELAESLAEIPGIESSFVVTGDQDVFLEARSADLQAFSDLMLNHVQAARGVATTRTIFVMREWRGGAA
jgi:Lrp/AsnC family transcriptional regulator, leucine-responsive regulatory protein